MIAAKDQNINEASKTIFQLSADEQIRKRCRDREEYYLDLRAYEREVENSKKIIEEKEKALSENEKAIAEKDSALLQKDNEIKQLRSLLAAHGIRYAE